MQRFPDWPQRLQDFIASAQQLSFAWGTIDCGQLVGLWIQQATGVDVAAPYRATYKTEAQAEALFLAGYSDLGAFAADVAARNAMPEILPVTYAQRGDVVWVDNSTPDNPSPYGALGIVSPDGRYAMCMSSTGAVRVHLSRWRRGWTV